MNLKCSTYGTHDHPSIHSFYNGLIEMCHGEDREQGQKEIRQLMQFLGPNPENPPAEFDDELLVSFMKTLLELPCWLTVMMITDLLGTTQRFNVPGLAASCNWTQRMSQPINSYETNSSYSNKINSFASLIEGTGRISS